MISASIEKKKIKILIKKYCLCPSLAINKVIFACMKPFLKHVADRYFNEGDISDRCFIFPNRRSMVFFRKYLAEAAASSSSGCPLLLPQMMTINDFFAKASGLMAADRITLLLELYDCYAALNPKAESLDDFIFWGDVILGDFDDVDKYLADPRQIFANIADYKQIQDTFSYLTDVQREALEAFVGHFRDDSGKLTVNLDSDDPAVKERFLQIWNILQPLYDSFNRSLLEKGLAYEGMIYRTLASAEDMDFAGISGMRYVFVGLNALNECEKKVMKTLKQRGMAEFCWDWYGEMVKDPKNRSSFFMSDNVEMFGQDIMLEAERKSAPEFNVLSVPSSYGQVKQLGTILEKADDPEGTETAVVLPDESLLLPLLNSVPESVRDINVTMGYPLSASSVFGLMSDIAKMQMHLRLKDDRWHFYHKHVWDILSNGMLRCRERADAVRKDGKFYIPQDDLNGLPLLDLVFRPVLTDLSSNDPDQIDSFAGYLQEILSGVVALMPEDDGSAIEIEAAKAYYTSVNSLRARRLKVLPSTFVRLLETLISGASVPFEGEPLKGMQVMGPLETRALDFRNVVVLSCNEGMFPRRSVSSSFVPPELRKAFGLPTYEYQDSVWAYYFYRMVCRAEKVWLVYDSRTEGLKRGEESRYIKQLAYHYGMPLKRYVADAEISALEVEDGHVEKTDEIMEALDAMSFSVSALQNYVFCPMKFYYHSVLKLKPDEEVAESLDSRMIGNVYHNAMYAIYYGEEAMTSSAAFNKLDSQPDKGMAQVSAAYLENWLAEDRLEALTAKVETLMKAELNVDEIRGRDLVVRTVITRYVLETLRKEVDFLKKSGADAFTVIGLEKKIGVELFGCRFFGVADRIDSVIPGTVRLVDYKSGSDSQKVLAVTDDKAEDFVAKIFDAPYKKGRKDFKAALQFHIYGRMLKEAGIAEEGRLFNSLYSTAEIFRNPPVMFPESVRFSKLMDERLAGLLAELKSKDVPFRRTEDRDTCAYCDFKMICGR